MHTVDVLGVCAAVLVLLGSAAVIARQRYMLHVAGGQPVAVRLPSDRWVYGIARFSGDRFLWYRALGVGTRPSKALERSQLSVLSHRAPTASESRSLPPTAVVVECRVGAETVVLALGESGFTGFVSWLEASAPRF